LAGDAALGLPAGELDPPPPAWLDDEAAGADAADEDADPESAGVLAADVAPDPVGALGVDELDAPEHPAMAPTTASAAAASSARLTRADEVITAPLRSCAKAHRMPCIPGAGTPVAGNATGPMTLIPQFRLGPTNRDNPHGCC